jgi:hypothetical protein
MLEKFLPQFKILDGISADSWELSLKKFRTCGWKVEGKMV